MASYSSDLAGAYMASASSIPENRPEATTDYIRLATGILGGIDDVVRGFKGMPRREEFALSLNQAGNPLMPNAFQAPNYSDVMSDGVFGEGDAINLSVPANAFDAAVQAAPEPVDATPDPIEVADASDDIDVYVWDGNKQLKFKKGFLEDRGFQVLQSPDGSVTGYVEPTGKKVEYIPLE